MFRPETDQLGWQGMRSWPEKRERRARIEIIPMIDVMMFLLVFFVLISINVLPALGLKVHLPTSAKTERIVEQKKITLTIAKDGTVLLDGVKTTVANLPEQLNGLKVDPDNKPAVIIAGDEGTEVQQLVDVLDALKVAQFPAASIVSKAK